MKYQVTGGKIQPMSTEEPSVKFGTGMFSAIRKWYRELIGISILAGPYNGLKALVTTALVGAFDRYQQGERDRETLNAINEKVQTLDLSERLNMVFASQLNDADDKTAIKANTTIMQLVNIPFDLQSKILEWQHKKVSKLLEKSDEEREEYVQKVIDKAPNKFKVA